jgi:hypothetical protein
VKDTHRRHLSGTLPATAAHRNEVVVTPRTDSAESALAATECHVTKRGVAPSANGTPVRMRCPDDVTIGGGWRPTRSGGLHDSRQYPTAPDER